MLLLVFILSLFVLLSILSQCLFPIRVDRAERFIICAGTLDIESRRVALRLSAVVVSTSRIILATLPFLDYNVFPAPLFFSKRYRWSLLRRQEDRRGLLWYHLRRSAFISLLRSFPIPFSGLNSFANQGRTSTTPRPLPSNSSVPTYLGARSCYCSSS